MDRTEEIIDLLEQEVENKKRKRRLLRILAWTVLVPATAFAFYAVPSMLADTIAYKQSQKYGKKKEEVDTDDE